MEYPPYLPIATTVSQAAYIAIEWRKTGEWPPLSSTCEKKITARAVTAHARLNENQDLPPVSGQQYSVIRRFELLVELDTRLVSTRQPSWNGESNLCVFDDEGAATFASNVIEQADSKVIKPKATEQPITRAFREALDKSDLTFVVQVHCLLSS